MVKRFRVISLRGQNALFGDSSGEFKNDWKDVLPEVKEWTTAELSRNEKSAIGFFLSTHPLDEFQNTLNDLRILNIADFENNICG